MSSLTYDRLAKGFLQQDAEVLRDGQYYAVRNGSAFMQIGPATKSASDSLTGWKFHMTIDPERVPEAWDIVQEQVVEAGLFAKVTTPDASDRFSHATHPQRGKMITIYDDSTRDRDWGIILSEIEEQLMARGVAPSQPVHIDRPVDGSQYFSYTNDRDLNMEYIDGKDRSSYNHAGHPDPFKEISIGKDRERSQGVTSLDVARLNRTLAPAIGRYADTIESEGWMAHAGSENTPFPHARLTLSSAGHSQEIADAFSASGIEAHTAQKGESHLVVIPVRGMGNLTKASFENTQKHLVAFEARDMLAQTYQENIPEQAWTCREAGDAMCDVPSVRISTNKAERAEGLVQNMREQTGLDAYTYAHTAQNGQVYHTVVMPVQNAMEIAEKLEVTPEQSLGHER